MAVKLSPVFNDAQLDSSGNPYTGAQLFTYAAGSTTKQTAYQDSGGSSQHTNPIILNSRGEPPAPIWLTEGLTYKFLLTTPTDTDPPITSVRTIDNVRGVNDSIAVAADEWVGSGLTPTYVSATSFTLSGDQTTEFHKSRRLKTTNSGGTVYSSIVSAIFGAVTTVTVVNDSGASLDSGLSAVSYSLVRANNPSINAEMVNRKAASVTSAATTDIWSTAGNLVHITGSTGPITSFGTAPYAGAEKTLIFDSTPSITHNATSLQLPGGVNLTMAAGDRAVVRADTTTNAIVTQITRASGIPVAGVSGFAGMKNGTIVQTRSGNAETFAIKTLAGNDPSATDPVTITFRDQAATTGGFIERQLTAATSLTVSSGSTLGCVNNEAFRLWLVAFDDAGTVRLGVIKATTGSDAAGWNIYPLYAFGIASSTAEGGGGAADSAQVFYTGAAVTTKPYIMIGYSTWESGLAAVGTWGTAPSRIQLYGAGVPLPGTKLSSQRSDFGAVATGTTAFANDDVVPTTAYGDQYGTVTYANVSSAANLLRHKSSVHFQFSAGAVVGGLALFRDAVANAIVSTAAVPATSSTFCSMSVDKIVIAGASGSTTTNVRVGSASGATTTVNGVTAARKRGGSLNSYVEIEEYMA